MQVIISFFIYTVICLLFTYYYNLFISQSVYTRSELGNILPQLSNMLLIIISKHSIFYILVFYLASGFTAMLILSLFENWFFNSALLPFIFFITAPRVALYFEQTRVTLTEDYKDILESFFTKYHPYILSGFFSGYSSKLMDNWVNYNFFPFYWLFINLVIISAITVILLRKEIFD